MKNKLSDKDIRRKKIVGYVRMGAVVCTLGVISIVIANFVRPSLSLESADVAQASKGTLEVSVGATGTVTPFYEESITSPISTKILEVYKKSGEQVHCLRKYVIGGTCPNDYFLDGKWVLTVFLSNFVT